MGDMRGRTVLITGANTGIGRAVAEGLAGAGARVYFAGRSEDRTRPVIDATMSRSGNPNLHFLPLDLADLASVRACAAAFLATGEPLHVLIDNAGLAGAGGSTVQGFETTFGVNHLGHFLLTLCLKPALERAAPSRVVVVASAAHEQATGIDFERLRQPQHSWTGWPEYRVSKLCNVLFAKELARRWSDAAIHAYAVHPGVIATDIWRRLPWPLRTLIKRFMAAPAEGARSTLYCAVAPDLASQSGRYFDEEGRVHSVSPLAEDRDLAWRLWEMSELWVRDYLD
jgi:retinol dehydrogenase-12